MSHRLPTCALAVSAAALASILAANAASAATLAALQDGKSIVMIDTKAKKITRSVTLDGGASLIGIDVRPADKKLYGVTADGAIVVVDAQTGKWEKKSQISEPLPKGAQLSVDFNPAADRLRIIGSDGTSLRINVEDGKTTVDGKLKFAEGDAQKAKTPKVVAVGYTNSVAGTKETALYDVDSTTGALLKQAPPNDGILNTVGMLGVKLDGQVSFDVESDGNGGNTAWLMSGNMLYTVDIATGKAAQVGAIAGLKGKVNDIAAMPAM